MATGASKSSDGGAGAGGIRPPAVGHRAIDAALGAGAGFQTRCMRAARRAGRVIADRWAPEGGAAGQHRSLRTLSFADRLLTPYVAQAEGSASPRLFRSSGSGAAVRPMRAAQPTSWVFPVPWYVDELEWMAAARAGAESSRQQAVVQARPGAVARAVAAVEGRRAPRREASRPVGVSVALEYVAPSIGRAPATRRAARPVFHASAPPAVAAPLRAWSSLASYQATQAAEIVAGVLAASESEEIGEGEGELAALPAAAPVMSMVSPSELAPSPASAPGRGARPRGLLAGVRARLENALALHRAGTRRARARAPESMVVVAPTAPTEPGVSGTATAPAAQVETLAPSSAAPPSAPTETHSTGAAPTQPMADAGEQVAVTAATPREPTSPGAEVEPSAFRPVHVASPTPTQVATSRALELLTSAALSGGRTLAPVSGPRVALPAGLGGLVAGVRAAEVVGRPLGRPAYAQPLGAAGEAPAPAAAPPRSAFAALQERRPVSFAHVAWADRWLARFAGASDESLATLRPAAAARTQAPVFLQRPYAQLARAPGAVYISGDTPIVARSRSRIAAAPASTPAAGSRPSSALAPRFDDAAPVSDEVFRQIAAAGAPRKTSAPRAGAPELAAAAAKPTALTVADRLVRRPPVAPGPGVRPGLAASPLAPALANVLPLPPSSSFDVRAIAPDDAGDAFLDGLVEPVLVRMSVRRGQATPLAMTGARAIALAPGMLTTDVRVLERLAARAPYAEVIAGGDRLEALAGEAPSRGVAAATPTSGSPAPHAVSAPTSLSAPGLPPMGEPVAEDELFSIEAITPYVTPLSSPMMASLATAAPLMPAVAYATPAGSAAAALPPSGATGYRDLAATWLPRPGRIAQLAHTWAVEQEHQSADLSLDFVAPELIIAARAYGFGPAQATQAARLSLAGEPGLSAMASAVDMTLLQAMSVADSQGRRAPAGMPARFAPAGRPAPGVAAPGDVGALPASVARPAAEPALAGVALPERVAPPPPTFSAAARMPRGAFLWPSAAVTALGLSAMDAESARPHTLAALDLLAARAVAEAGAFPMVSPDWAALAAQPEEMTAERSAAPPPVDEAAATGARARSVADSAASAVEPEAVLPQGARLPPEFHEIFVALSQSPAGRALPPSVRAARALALAEQAAAGKPVSARARAAAAWAVMPMVYTAGEAAGEPRDAKSGEALAERAAAGRGAEFVVAGAPRAQPRSVRRRPGGMHAVAARAGEALGSLVAPADRAAQQGEARPRRGALHMAPTAAQPLVQTGAKPEDAVERAVKAARSDTTSDIPPWFEAAARRHLADSVGGGEGISFAEMTLVTAAPARQVAASRVEFEDTQRPLPRPASNEQGESPPPDIEKIARDVYSRIVRMIDIARERSGDPWLS